MIKYTLIEGGIRRPYLNAGGYAIDLPDVKYTTESYPFKST